MKNYIGTVLFFDEAAGAKMVQRWQPALEEIKQLAVVYESLDTSYKFTQAIYDDIMQNKCLNIARSYRETVEWQIRALNITAKAIAQEIRNNIEHCLNELSVCIETMCKTINQGILDFADCKIINGQPVLDENSIEKINATFRIVVETPEQNSIYVAVLEVQNAYKKLSELASTRGRDLFHTPIIGDTDTCYLSQTENGELVINAHCINFV